MSETVMEEFRVGPSESGKRLDQAVASLLPTFSRSRLQQWIKSGELTVNGEVRAAKSKVYSGERIRVMAVVQSAERWVAQDIDLDVIYDDAELIVIDKPAGLVVHPAAGHADGTLVNALLQHYPELDTIPRAGVVHRLDKDTSGLLVVARTLEAHTALVRQLQARTVGREYEAIVNGVLMNPGKVDAPIGRSTSDRKKMAVVPGGKPAVTHYSVLNHFTAHTHVRCRLETGRTHQIRVHLAHIGYPLVGDPVYGQRAKGLQRLTETARDAVQQFSRQALHARRLRLLHPRTGEGLEWESPLPEDMVSLLAALRLEE